MKTTIELPDGLLEHAKRLARQEGTSLRRLFEEGLHRVFHARRKNMARRQLDIPSYGGSGLTQEFEGAEWNKIRDAIRGEHVA
ncbi:MAG: DUF2191 domain-containing protein [Gammaproteobacteria bacterium]|nr:DUF2191 domain-containing protein [Gammaproteobacteria bacterium]